MFYAIVWGKEETKMLTARIVVGSFQRKFRANYPIHSVRENDKLMNTMGQFSRTDSLLFKDRSFSCTLDLAMQIQLV